MAITDFTEDRKRPGLIFLGAPASPEDQRVFTDRGFRVYDDSVSLTPEQLCLTDSVIISQDELHPLRLHKLLAEHAETILNYDCRLYIRVAAGRLQERGRAIAVNAIQGLQLPSNFSRDERARIPEAQRETEGLPFAPFVFVCDVGVSWPQLADIIVRNPAGWPPSPTLNIDAEDSTGKQLCLTATQTLLLRRAFWDCKTVHLLQMSGGLSGAYVFRAYTELQSGLDGNWPLLHFVKIGDRRSIVTEYTKYRGHAAKYIPFNLSPRLDLDRCGLGSRDGIIVGDFVEHAEPLRDVAASGRASHAIGNLFGRTLRGWHHGASEQSHRSLPDALVELFPTNVPHEREARIRALGSMRTLPELRTLFEKCHSQPVLVGTIHADLNATNVLLRGSDAVVIDFEKLREAMPVIYDPASVEAALLVDGFANDRGDEHVWLKSIESLYNVDTLFGPFPNCHPRHSSAWFFECVRQIRQHGRELERAPGQYATALAFALLKKSCNPANFGSQEGFRAAAYVLADRLLASLANDAAAPPP